ncbi:MAG TPA: DUF1566 domain-containing protein [bacterium]|nr:DUF1566 domain-containing protein [bacterium]
MKKIETVAGRYEIFNVDNEELVVDLKTGLMWQRSCSEKEFEWRNEVEKYVEDLRLGGFSDWRLPTIEELKTLVTGVSEEKESGEKNKGPGENGFYMEKGVWVHSNNNSGYFWSSTSHNNYSANKLGVAFNTGNVFLSYDLAKNFVRVCRFYTVNSDG